MNELEDVNVAVLHDRFPQLGGGEQFALEVARVLEAPIYTAYVSDGVELPSDVTVIPMYQDKYTGGLLRKKILGWKEEGMNPIEPVSVMVDFAQGCTELDEYDVVFESGPLSKSYIPTPEQKVLNYPHSPPRWLYDLYRERLGNFQTPVVSFALKLFAKGMRPLDKEANDYVDTFIGNSEIVSKRIQRYYGVDSETVYPPIKSEKWYNAGSGDYFLTWSRLTPKKRVDLIVKAFQGLEERLVVAGTGTEQEYIKELATGHDNIQVLGYTEDIEELVAKSKAVVYAPQEEDFGMVGAEALMAGKPLLGVNEGYTKYQVQDGVTGIHFEPTVSSLREAIQQFDESVFDSTEIQEFAQRYSYAKFEMELKRVVREVIQESENEKNKLQ